MHNLEYILENGMYKLLWDFEIKMDHLISAWPPSLVVVNKKENLRNSVLCYPGRPLSENKRNPKKR